MNKKKEEPNVLVCAPAKLAKMVSRGSIFTHKCGACGEPVATAPSGQAFLRKHPTAVIVCYLCLKTHVPEAPRERERYLSSDGTPHTSRDVVAAEMEDVVPNTWRDRN